MKQLHIKIWYEFRRLTIYYTGARRVLKLFLKPDRAYRKVTDISPEVIREIKEEMGIKGIILDMDGTIKHYSKGIPEDIKDWVEMIKVNFKLCLLSNATEKLVEEATIPLKIDNYVYKAHKPSEEGFNKAVKILGLPKEEILVIGDALVGDVLGSRKNGLKVFSVDDLNAKRKVK